MPAFAVSFGLGILSACHVVLSPLLVAGLLMVLTLLLWLRHRWAMVLISCLLFVVAGHLRALFPDFSLLPDGLVRASARWADVLSARIHAWGLPADAEGLMQAMLLGRREGLPEVLRTLYNNVGASHVLALSGLHVSVLFLLPGALFLRVLTWPWARWCVAGSVVALLWLYVVLTGCSPSLVRSAVMVSLFTVGLVRQTGVFSWHTLGLAALLILLFTPSALLRSVSFQLSFSAVAGILLFYRQGARLAEAGLPARWFCGGVLLSLAAQLGCTPLVAHYFHTLSLSSVVLSPLYILLATCILYLGLAGLVVGGYVASLLGLLIGWQHGLMRWVASVPLLAPVDLTLSPLQVVLVWLSAAFLMSAIRAEDRRPWGAVRPDRPYRLLGLWPRWLIALAFAALAVGLSWVG